jgi:hypoxanthine phosphoribosyltransferase
MLTSDELRSGVARMAEDINRTYGETPLTIVGVLTGSVVLLADLMRFLNMPVRVGVLHASSYRNNTRPGELIVNRELMLDISKHHTLLVDDIFDTGHTMVRVLGELREFEPSSLRTAVLLRKAARKEVEYLPDFIGFEIPDEFVVGYGLDYREMYRNLPFLAALEPADLAGDKS